MGSLRTRVQAGVALLVGVFGVVHAWYAVTTLTLTAFATLGSLYCAKAAPAVRPIAMAATRAVVTNLRMFCSFFSQRDDFRAWSQPGTGCPIREVPKQEACLSRRRRSHGNRASSRA